MSFWFTIQGAERIGAHMWVADMTPADVQHFGQTQQRVGLRSVVGVVEPNYNESVRALSIHPEAAKVFNVGSTNEVLIIDIGQRGSNVEDVRATSAPVGINDSFHGKRGDREFLEACKENLQSPLPEMVEYLLTQIRREYPGKLHEGKHRKWVNYPENFLALTIQNRDQSFAVYVKGNPDDFHAPSLNIKPDRPGYSRFKLQTKKQLEETIRVILSSARRSVK